jgi:ATP-dependent DNA ligase
LNGDGGFAEAPAPVVYCVVDLQALAGRDVMREPLKARRALLE